jgi:phosphate transport system substrate-binding protein
MYPNVTIQITSGLSGIAPPALSAGKADFAAMARAMTDAERDAFARKFGYPPTEIRIAADAIAIYVEKSNPIDKLTLEQLDGILSRTHRLGGKPIDTWGELGVRDVGLASKHINLYGFAPGAAANEVLRQTVMNGGDFRVSLLAQPVDSSVVQAVAADPSGIGFASTFFACKRVRAVPIGNADGRFFAPTEQNVHSGDYPLKRYLAVYINRAPGRPLNPATLEFIRYLYSREGQQMIAAAGNLPIDTPTLVSTLRALEP